MALLSEFDSGEFLRGYIAIFKEKLTNIISQYQTVFGNSIKGTDFRLLSCRSFVPPLSLVGDVEVSVDVRFAHRSRDRGVGDGLVIRRFGLFVRLSLAHSLQSSLLAAARDASRCGLADGSLLGNRGTRVERADRLEFVLDEDDLLDERLSTEEQRRVRAAAERVALERRGKRRRGEENLAAGLFDGGSDPGESDERFHRDVQRAAVRGAARMRTGNLRIARRTFEGNGEGAGGRAGRREAGREEKEVGSR